MAWGRSPSSVRSFVRAVRRRRRRCGGRAGDVGWPCADMPGRVGRKWKSLFNGRRSVSLARRSSFLPCHVSLARRSSFLPCHVSLARRSSFLPCHVSLARRSSFLPFSLEGGAAAQTMEVLRLLCSITIPVDDWSDAYEGRSQKNWARLPVSGHGGGLQKRSRVPPAQEPARDLRTQMIHPIAYTLCSPDVRTTQTATFLENCG